MAMSYHMEARIKQDRLNRWCDQKRRNERDSVNQTFSEKPDDAAYKNKMDKVLITDPGQFNQIRSVHAWTGIERNRRFYDYSANGPLLGSSWRDLRRELNFREKSLSSGITNCKGRAIPRNEFLPTDVAFTGK